LMTSAHSAYSTPLGEVEVASRQVSAVNRLLALSKGSKIEPIAYDREHSLEIQLPFLQTALVKPFQLLPIMVRTNDPVILKDTAEALAEVVENEISQSKKVLLIASTDLSHFYSEVEAKRYDDYMLAKMASFTPEGVLEAELSRKGFACGAGAVALVLWTTQFLGANKVTILNYSTSARASGDRSSVVGYGAAAITRQG
jgi:AmmeMemoRadiSam system protein B